MSGSGSRATAPAWVLLKARGTSAINLGKASRQAELNSSRLGRDNLGCEVNQIRTCCLLSECHGMLLQSLFPTDRLTFTRQQEFKSPLGHFSPKYSNRTSHRLYFVTFIAWNRRGTFGRGKRLIVPEHHSGGTKLLKAKAHLNEISVRRVFSLDHTAYLEVANLLRRQ